MTPSKPVITSDDPLTVTLKSMAKERQNVMVEVQSYLFEIINPRAMNWPKTQLYRVIEPGETLSFQIGVTRESPKGHKENHDVRFMRSPRGQLKISHNPTEKKGDTDKDWGFTEDEKSTDFKPKGKRTIVVCEHHSVEHGYFEMEMSYERETEVIKKRTDQYYAIKEQIEEDDKKRSEEKERLLAEKEKKKKKKCCSIL